MYAIFTSVMSGGELPGLWYQLCTVKRPAASDRSLREPRQCLNAENLTGITVLSPMLAAESGGCR